MVQQAWSKAEQQITLPPELQKNVDALVAWAIGIAKEAYIEDPLKPFSVEETRIKREAQEKIHAIYKEYQRAHTLLKERFEWEEKHSKKTGEFEGATSSILENALKTARKEYKTGQFEPSLITALQDQLSIPDAYMHRAYRFACSLFQEKKYEDAECVYAFLRQLQPAVFEYWMGEASAQHMVGEFKEALDTYSISLILDPDSPVVWFQMADCCLKTGEKESAAKCLEYCMEHAVHNKEHEALYNAAKQIKNSIK